MGQVADTATGSKICGTPASMENAMPGCSCPNPQETQDTSPETASGSGCRYGSSGMQTPLRGTPDEKGPDRRPRCKGSRDPSRQRRWTANPTTTTWKMMKSGQWMELRRDTRPPRTRRRKYAAGTETVWWPENTSWSMIQGLPREDDRAGVDLQTMAWRPYHQRGVTSRRQTLAEIPPHDRGFKRQEPGRRSAGAACPDNGVRPSRGCYGRHRRGARRRRPARRHGRTSQRRQGPGRRRGTRPQGHRGRK